MRISTQPIFATSLVLSLSMLAPMQSLLAHDLPGHDAMTAAVKHHKLLLENESVRVLETRIRPGERTAVHTHPWPAVVYVVSFSDIIRYDADGKVLSDSRNSSSKPQPGAALWQPDGPLHSVENVGTTDLVAIAIEIKPKQ